MIVQATDFIEIDGSTGPMDQFGNQFLSNLSAELLGTTGQSGRVFVDAGTVRLVDGGRIESSTFGQGNAGNMFIDAGQINISGLSDDRPSGILAIVGSNGEGNGGDLNIDVGSLLIRDGGQITTRTLGQGNAGMLTVQAEDIRLIGVKDDFTSEISSDVLPGAVGNSGNQLIQANRLIIRGGAVIAASTGGDGRAGDITIRAKDMLLEGFNEEGITEDAGGSSGIFAGVSTDGTGRAGNIQVQADRLNIEDGAVISAITLGKGRAGNIDIDVSDRLFINGAHPSFSVAIAISARTREGAESSAGNIIISTDEFFIGDGATINAQTLNDFRSGNITINANTFAAVNGGQIISNTSGGGRAGNIILNIADELQLVGRDTNYDARLEEFGETLTNEGMGESRIFANSRQEATGESGNINVNAANVVIEDSATISTQSEGEGNAGTIRVAVGQTLQMRDRAQITSSTGGAGDTGEINITANNSVSLADQSGITSAVLDGANGDAQQVIIQTPELSLVSNSQISASTSGSGNAGSIEIQEADNVSLDNSTISTAINSGAIASEPSNIVVNTRSLQLTNNANIIASTAGQGNGGTVTVPNAETIALSSSTISSEATDEATGSGGDITLRAGQMTLDNDALISAQSAVDLGEALTNRRSRQFIPSSRTTPDVTGNAGNILIVIDDVLLLEDSTISTQASAFSGGDITVQAGDLRLRGDGDIQTNVSGAAGGGNITLTAGSIIAFDDSDIVSSATAGVGGDITLETPAFFGENVQVNAPGDTDLNDRVDINATGAVSGGALTLPDDSTVQNSLTDLPEGLINTESLIANSCVVRNADGGSTFVITGNEGLRDRPSNLPSPHYSLGDIQTVDMDDMEQIERSDNLRSWRSGDPIIEPQGVYQLPNGELILSHSCS